MPPTPGGPATDESAPNTTEQSRTQSSPVTPRPAHATCPQTRVARPRHVPRGLVMVREPCPTGAGTVVDMTWTPDIEETSVTAAGGFWTQSDNNHDIIDCNDDKNHERVMK